MTGIDRRTALTTGLAATALLMTAPPSYAGTRALVGQPAPKFTLTTFAHQRVKLADLTGEVVVLNYWAVWCGPCKRELPDIDAYVRRRGADAPRVFAVTVDDTVTDSQLKPLAGVLSFPLVTRIDSFAYGPIDGAVPSNYVIDRAGIVRYARAGAFSLAELDQLITPLLAEPRPVATPPSTT